MLRQHGRRGVTGTFFPESPLPEEGTFMSCFRVSSCARLGKPFWESDPCAMSVPSAGETLLPPTERAAWSRLICWLPLTCFQQDPKLASINTTAPKFSQPDLACHCISHIMSFICSNLGSDPSSSLLKPHGCSFLTHYFYCDPKWAGLLITITFNQQFFFFKWMASCWYFIGFFCFT